MLDIDRYRGELIRRATAPADVAAAIWLVAELTPARSWRPHRPRRSRYPARRAHRDRLCPHTPRRDGRCCLSVAAAAGWSALAAVAAPRSTPPIPSRSAGVAAAGLAAPPPSRATCRRARSAASPSPSHPGRGAVVRRAGRAGAHRRPPRPVGPGAAPVLAAVAAVCGGAARRWRRRCRRDAWTRRSAVRHRIRPAVVRQDRGHGRALRLGVAQPHRVATRRTSHRATAVVSRSRSLFELAIMAVALTLAAALAVTG